MHQACSIIQITVTVSRLCVLFRPTIGHPNMTRKGVLRRPSNCLVSLDRSQPVASVGGVTAGDAYGDFGVRDLWDGRLFQISEAIWRR